MSPYSPQFPKIKKRFALNNSYFKNRHGDMPRDPFEVVEYLKEHGELPYNSEPKEHWLYECFCEYQKRANVNNQQFFTPPKTAERMAELLEQYGREGGVVDACCGFGMLSKEILKKGFDVRGFDNDLRIGELYKYYTGATFLNYSLYDYPETCIKNVIANPPYDISDMTAFLEKLYEMLDYDGIAIILTPYGFFEKERPKKLLETLRKFNVIWREDMTEPFERTGMKAQIYVVEKNRYY